jgi:hypothetical protein
MPSHQPLSTPERKLARTRAASRQAEEKFVKTQKTSQSDSKTKMPALDEGEGKGAEKSEGLNQSEYTEFKGNKKHET